MMRGASVALVASSGERSIKVVDYESGTTYFSFADTLAHRGGLVGLAGRASLDVSDHVCIDAHGEGRPCR